MSLRFENADEAYRYFVYRLISEGIRRAGTTTLFNVGFIIVNPADNLITEEKRKWSLNYARYEWDWYLSGNPSAVEIAKRAPIWLNHMDVNGNVNSNYGYQWMRGNTIPQIEYVIKELTRDPDSRRAVISIYDGKESELYSKDTPCTLSITFYVVQQTLCMSVHMRSNDIFYGFCNDQFCFSELQRLIAYRLNLSIGEYYHSVVNMHIYDKQRAIYDESEK